MTQDTQSAAPRNGQSDHIANAVFGLVFNGNGQVMDLWIRSSQVVAKGAADITQQIFAFGQARLADDIETWRTLASCRDLGEMVQCQKLFAERAAEQYVDQADKLSGEVNSIVAGALNTAALERV